MQGQTAGSVGVFHQSLGGNCLVAVFFQVAEIGFHGLGCHTKLCFCQLCDTVVHQNRQKNAALMLFHCGEVLLSGTCQPDGRENQNQIEDDIAEKSPDIPAVVHHILTSSIPMVCGRRRRYP